MKIKVKSKGQSIFLFEEYFKDIIDFIEFIEANNRFINPKNILDKVLIVYENLKNSQEQIKSSVLMWRINKEFRFNFKRPVKLKFWEERGFDMKEFNNYISNSKTGNNQFKKHQNNNKKINPIEDENEFEYGVFKFKLIGHPTCNLCNSNLNLSPAIGKYIIDGCNNKNCESNKNLDVITIRQLAFLPIKDFTNKNNKIILNSKLNKEYWLLNNFSYEESIIKSNEFKQKFANSINTLEFYQIAHGLSNEEANIKIKSNTVFSDFYWTTKGFSKDKAKEIVADYQAKNCLKFSKKRKETPHLYSAISSTQLGYWLNKGNSENEAKEKLSKRQATFSLDICIKKYGKKEGINRFNERQNKWNKSINDGGSLKIGYSKCSQDLFNSIINSYKPEELSDVLFATHGGEFKIQKEGGGIWRYDFVDLNRKKIIEYNGDMFHGNPKKYLPNDCPNPFNKKLTAQEMWNKDELKIKSSEKLGFDLLTIWDSEYRWGNKQKIINECLHFIGILK